MIVRVKRKLRNIKEQMKSKAVFLMYHRVIDLPNDPFNLAVSPENFAEQMAFLKQHCQPLSVAEFAECERQGNLPRRAVVVTFDDGYFDNFAYAHPILEAEKIPWTLFVTNGFIDRDREVWSDALGRVMLEAASLPERVELQIANQLHVWNTTTAQKRLEACLDLQRLLLPLRNEEREFYIDKLNTLAGIEQQLRPEYRMMTCAELQALVRSPFVEIGGHTISHPFLTTLAKEEQLTEIAAGREALASMVNQPVRSFAYPFGDYSERTVDLVKEAGFETAVTVNPVKVSGDIDLFQLGRFQVHNWNGNEFAQHINYYFIS